jgi:hypothetical protein
VRCTSCRVTGRGYMDINRISGYIPGKIVNFLMQVSCCAGVLSLLGMVVARVVVQHVSSPWPGGHGYWTVAIAVLCGLTNVGHRSWAGAARHGCGVRTPGRVLECWALGRPALGAQAPKAVARRVHLALIYKGQPFDM